MPRPKRSPSVSSARSSDSDGGPSDASMTSRRSKDSRKSIATSMSADNSCYDDRSVDAPQRGRGSNSRVDSATSYGRPDIKSNNGLTRLVQSTIAKLKKKGGCPIGTIKQEIKECYGYTLTGTHNTKRLTAVLKKLTKEGVLQKRGKSYSVVPASVLRRRRRHHSKHHRRHRRRGRGRSRGRKRRRRHRRHRRRRRRHGKSHKKKRRRRRRHSRRGRKRGRRSRSHRHRGKAKHTGRTRRRRGRSHAVAPRTRRLRRGVSTLAPSVPGPIPGPSRGGFVPGGGSPRVPSRNPSRVPSRAPSHLASRSHSPNRPGFDPRETPPTRSRRGSARASARNSPGPHLIDGLDDFDL